MSPKNLRRHRRFASAGPIYISWEDRGQPRYALAKCIDMSESGLRIEAPQSIPAGSTIQLRAERIQLAGAATVKHVTRKGSKYLLGIQLTQTKLVKAIAQLEQNPILTESL
jgi:hypothetical protein